MEIEKQNEKFLLKMENKELTVENPIENGSNPLEIGKIVKNNGLWAFKSEDSKISRIDSLIKEDLEHLLGPIEKHNYDKDTLFISSAEFIKNTAIRFIYGVMRHPNDDSYRLLPGKLVWIDKDETGSYPKITFDADCYF